MINFSDNLAVFVLYKMLSEIQSETPVRTELAFLFANRGYNAKNIKGSDRDKPLFLH